jgi:SNF2 family DNA or RNA helicase
MNDLYVGVNDEGLIEIRPGKALPPERWLQVATAWGQANAIAIRSRILKLEPNEFVQRMSWLRDSWRVRGGTVEVSAGVLETVKRVQQGKAEFEQLLHSSTSLDLEHPLVVPKLKRKLTDNQEQNVALLLRMKSGANFSVPGAGKTMTTLAVWKILRSRGAVDRLLVVCPRSAFASWEEEARDCFEDEPNVFIYDNQPIDPNAEIVVTNYEKLESSARLEYLSNWATRNSVHLVIDEAHRVKAGGASVRWRACKQLSATVKRVDLLTGTPMPQGPDDLASLYKLSWPALPHSFLNTKLLTSMRRNTTFVRTTKNELGLPEMKLDPIVRPPDELQAEIYSALRDQYSGVFGVSNPESALFARRGKAVMALLAASTNPGLLLAPSMQELTLGIQWPPQELRSNNRLLDLAREYLRHEMPWKFKFVAGRAEQLANEGKKVIIWSNFVGNLLSLQRTLELFSPALVYGAVGAEDRELEIQRFRNDASCTVLLTNPQTLGEGISLHHECHDAIYIDRTYNAGLYLQSLDRIHRLGLAPDTLTNVQILSTEGTIDMRVAARLELKIQRLGNFLDDAGLATSSLPQGDEIRPEDLLGMDDNDFTDLFKHLG